MNVLITGGAGFIGSHLVENLLKLGFNITVFDNLSTGKRENLPLKEIEFIKGDIRNRGLLKRILVKKRYDVIYHLCAQVSVDRSIDHRMITITTNINGTVNLLEAILKAYSSMHYPLLIHVSSCEVYGSMIKNPMDEKHPLNPCTPYAATKLSAEKLTLAYHYTYKIPVLIVRPFNCYGPRQRGGRYGAVIPNFILRIMHGLSPLIHGNGNQTRDFLYITDLINAMVQLIKLKGNGEVINIGSGNEISINDLASMLLKLMNRVDIVPKYVKSPRPKDIERQKADISKAKKLLKWRPKVSLKEGLKETIKFWKMKN